MNIRKYVKENELEQALGVLGRVLQKTQGELACGSMSVGEAVLVTDLLFELSGEGHRLDNPRPITLRKASDSVCSCRTGCGA